MASAAAPAPTAASRGARAAARRGACASATPSGRHADEKTRISRGGRASICPAGTRTTATRRAHRAWAPSIRGIWLGSSAAALESGRNESTTPRRNAHDGDPPG